MAGVDMPEVRGIETAEVQALPGGLPLYAIKFFLREHRGSMGFTS
jgi:hypothetical protein